MRIVVDSELRKKMIVPAIVLTEYVKIAGARLGAESALSQISNLRARGALVAAIDEEIATTAGRLLRAHSAVPTANAVIVASAKVSGAGYIISDDPHYEILGMKTRWLKGLSTFNGFDRGL